jgi:putative AlgH/UPF0301 family transcriptional regulator
MHTKNSAERKMPVPMDMGGPLKKNVLIIVCAKKHRTRQEHNFTDKKTIVIRDDLSQDSGTAFYSRNGEKRFFKIIEKDQME